jgi:hypothetical protein
LGDAKATVPVLSEDDFHEVLLCVLVVFVGTINEGDFVGIELQLPGFPKVGHDGTMVCPAFGCP